MRTFRNIFLAVLVLLVVFILGLLSRPILFPLEPLEAQTDTLYIRDTIHSVKPKIVREKVLVDKYIYVPKDSLIHDTAYIKLPITQRYYHTENYAAWVSGYKPNLDSIDIFNTTKIIKETTTIQIKKNTLYLSAGISFNKSLYYPIELGYRYDYKMIGIGAGVLYEPMTKTFAGQVKLNINLIRW